MRPESTADFLIISEKSRSPFDAGAGFFCRFHMRDSVKALILLSLAFLLATAEHAVTGPAAFPVCWRGRPF